MSQQTESRKRALKVALARLDMTAKGFAEAQGITQTQLYEVLRGRRVSPRLSAAIDALIERADREAAA